MVKSLQYLGAWILKRLPKGSVILTLITGLSVLIGVGREAIIAYFFGTSAELDAFLVAVTIPKLITLQAANVSVSVILPLYVAMRERKEFERASSLVSSWFLFSAGVLLLVCVLLFIFAQPLVRLLAPGLDATSEGNAIAWLRVLLVYLWIFSVCGGFRVVLDSHKVFAPSAIDGLVLALAVIASCVLLGHRWGVEAMIPGYLVGAALAFWPQYTAAKKLEPTILRWRVDWSKIRELPFSSAMYVQVQSLLTQLNGMVDRAFASGLPTGSIAALNYASSVTLTPSLLITQVLATALFPVMARQVANGNARAAFRSVVRWILVFLVGSGLLVGLFIVFRTEVVRLLFARGAFDEESVQLCASILSVLPWMMLFTGSSAILNRLLLSMQAFRFTAGLAFFLAVVKITLNFVLVEHMGVVGLALATVLAALAGTLLRFFYCWYLVRSYVNVPFKP